MKNRFLHIFFIFLFSTAFISCTEKASIHELESHELIPALKALHKANISADIVRVKPVSNYRIQINKKDYPQALQVIKASGLLRKNNRQDELSKSASVLPFDPEKANLRRDYAYAEQLEATLSAVEGVVSVHAAVRSGGVRSFGSSQQAEPKATIIVRYRALQDSKAVSSDELKQIAAQVVPSLDVSNIILITTVNNQVGGNAEDEVGESTKDMLRLSPFTFYLLASEYSAARRQIIFVVLITFLVGILVGVFLFYSYRLLKTPNHNPILNSLSRKNTILFNRKDLDL